MGSPTFKLPIVTTVQRTVVRYSDRRSRSSVPALLSVSALAGVAISRRRAMRINPIEAIRAE
jgi:hypothetical protein